MVEAYVLVTTGVGKVRNVLESIEEIEGVKNIHIVTGPFDLIVMAEASDMSTLMNVVIEEIGKVEGVTDTNTSVIIE